MDSDDSGGSGDKKGNLGLGLGALGFGEEETDAHLRAATGGKRRRSEGGGKGDDGDPDGKFKMGSQDELGNQFFKRLFLIGFVLFFVGSVYYYWADPNRGTNADGSQDGPKYTGPHRFVPSWYGNN